MLSLTAQTRIRLARPSLDLAAAERFYGRGLGLEVLNQYEATSDTEFSLLMLGLPGATWHLELTHSALHRVQPTPSADDLLVLYLGEVVSEITVKHLEACGGVRVAALNPYWDDWGVTLADPDGYRLVLCRREWSA
ncbi:VOC family protein [Deinococcus rubellus]|uniref:VOC family protein n=1 Tax=Deinococcus rubellus TaxID=1889240 RepID=A0ABY5YHU0_9DEIO|nr:VOC family protein [Deinococcus rubellus]UWX63937.1 VOC family protein [Deinococcus rubellus]